MDVSCIAAKEVAATMDIVNPKIKIMNVWSWSNGR